MRALPRDCDLGLRDRPEKNPIRPEPLAEKEFKLPGRYGDSDRD